MNFKFPKNDEKYSWTNHVSGKMMYYGLSADRVKRVVRSPYRSEKGIAPNTVAVMQPSSAKAPAGKAWKEEIWVMYATAKPKVKSEKFQDLKVPRKVIITAWRYPGISKVREAIPIPSDILEELKSIRY
ncbi:MAG: hypothetical protein WD989_01920 [Candidatus Paceibacterota bacterium]